MTEISWPFQISGQLCNFRNFRTAGTPELVRICPCESAAAAYDCKVQYIFKGDIVFLQQINAYALCLL